MSETLLDAPADTTQGADAKDASLLDTKPEADTDGSKTSPDATLPTDAPKADATKTDEPVKPVVPETYELKLPENVQVDPAFKAEYDTLAKSLGLSQEGYQKLADLQLKTTEAQMTKTMEVFNKQIQDWTEETKKELGADPAKALSVASKAIDRIFSDPKENADFRDMMKTTGLGNWRLMVKAFTYVGKAISEDKFVEGTPNAPKRKSNEEVFFDHPTSIAAMQDAAATK